MLLHLLARPHADLEDPLQFFWRVVPAIRVAQFVGWKVIVDFVPTTSIVGTNVVRLPSLTNHNLAATDVTEPIAFEKYLVALRS